MAEDLYKNVPDGMTTPPLQSNQKQDRASLVKELSPKEHLRTIIKELEGKVWDDEKSRYVDVAGGKEFLNEEGRRVFYQYATGMISPIVTMSNYNKDFKLIHKLVGNVYDKAAAHFYTHWKDYGIARKGHVGIILSKLLNLGISSFYKAIGAGDRKAATSNISENISTLSRFNPQQNQKRSFLSRFNPMNNGGRR